MLMAINLDVENPQLAANFKASEFRSKDSDKALSKMLFIDTDLVEKLQEMRTELGKAITIVSGFRTAAHNRTCGGANDSQHMHGTAADIRISGLTPNAVCKIAQKMGFGGIGEYKDFTHVDIRGKRYYWSNLSGKEVSVASFL